MSEGFLFADEQEEELVVTHGTWKILIVDDESEVHTITKLALSDFIFQNKALDFISAYSGEEAKRIIAQQPDIAVVLLDVVMETDDAGLSVARYVREELKNEYIRIILRTGQPGQAPERQVIVDYDINDYKSKTELTLQKLFTTMMSSLRSYRDIMSIEQSRLGLEKIIHASADLFSAHSMEQFIEGVLLQLTSVLGCHENALLVSSSFVAGNVHGEQLSPEQLVVFAGQGDFEHAKGQLVQDVLPTSLLDAFNEALKAKSVIYRDDYLVAYCTSEFNQGALLYISGLPSEARDNQRKLIELFAKNVKIAYDNVQLQQELECIQSELLYRLSANDPLPNEAAYQRILRIGHSCYQLACAMGISSSDAKRLMLASPLVQVNNQADSNNKALGAQGVLGVEALAGSKRKIIQIGELLAKELHEKWDGSGLPNGKKGDEISLYSRIYALATAYDAARIQYANTGEQAQAKALMQIEAASGTHFSPKVVQILKLHVDKLEAILQKYPHREQ